MKAFEDAKFQEWKQRTEQILPTLQKRNVLKELPPSESEKRRFENEEKTFRSDIFLQIKTR